MLTMNRVAGDKPAVSAVSKHWNTWGMPTAGLLILLAVVGFGWTYRQVIWDWLPDADTAGSLRWIAALLPGSIIINHMVYLMTSRRGQFREALMRTSDTHEEAEEAKRLEGLYFGSGTVTVRYLIPALLVIALCIAAMAALNSPWVYLPWLYAPGQPAMTWPTGWGEQVLRGAALGFAGAYVYLLLLLTDRARQRDVTTGIAAWAAAMPILGPLMGGVAALLILTGTGAGESFTQDAVFFVAGMLPRQFATIVQSGVRKAFASGAPAVTRSQPLTMLRGVGAEVEVRLEEEGIHDVASLAYASPHQLMRTTRYSARQIVDWIDEALLISTVPEHWQALEKSGVTGTIDLAWYATNKDADGKDYVAALASEVKMPEPMLRNVVVRLSQDAQVDDLHKLYWDTNSAALRKRDGQGSSHDQHQQIDGERLQYPFKSEITLDARERLIPDINKILGVRQATMDGDQVTVVVDPAQREAIDALLRGKSEFRQV